MSETILLDGSSLTRTQLVAVARRGAPVALDQDQLKRVQRAADFLADKVSCGEPTYGVTTGFGSNADKLLGAHRVRDELPGHQCAEGTLMEELQHNLIITHAVCVGKPFAAEVVRAMLVIRINTLMRGHSGIRVSTLQALAAMLNAGVVPVVPEKGSVGASGDLAPLSHLAIVLLGGGEAFYEGKRMPGAQALERAGLKPIRLSFKEGLALNNGTAQMLATGALALDVLGDLLDVADLAAAMTLDAFAGRSGALRPEVHALRPHPGQVDTAAHVRELLDGSTLLDIPYHLVPRFKPWSADAWSEPDDQALSFDIGWDWVPANQRHGREAFYARFLPFKGGKKHQPQDAYSLRCMPQVHGAVRDAWSQACRVFDIELNSVTDNPLIFPDAEGAQFIGFMIVQYTAAALVNDLATRAHPASVYSVPTSANAEDHVSMGANEARHVLDMVEDLGHALALELYTAAQALDYRQEMLNAARRLARRGGWQALAAKVANAPREGQPHYRQFVTEVQQLADALDTADDFHAGTRVRQAHAILRERIAFLHRDRALDGDVAAVCALVQQGAFRATV